jgi:hypothetical protein
MKDPLVTITYAGEEYPMPLSEVERHALVCQSDKGSDRAHRCAPSGGFTCACTAYMKEQRHQAAESYRASSPQPTR